MSVYVDDALQEAQLSHGRRTLYARWSHLLADDTAELVAFGRQLDLRSSWLQAADTPQEHFDVTASKRSAALRLGATAVSIEEKEALVRCKRAGLPFHLEQLREDPGAFQVRFDRYAMAPHRRSTGPRRMRLRGPRDKLPSGAVLVMRPSRWANPYPVAARSTVAHQAAVDRFREYLARNPDLVLHARADLAGKDLACTCPPHQPCHADVWLDLVNPEDNATL